ncbi:hypothetical protein H2198_000569 [Neophaeococcomyces mojaviensis]|uniref:Uncharacterized protein n=1 Tax=Neophaeococcomyces mojaviensis TaxID=3383035 RepID=A0ACC3AJA0_9EURO|nr:hypothetical protein H2198_000569 [Knufia sp. JES_112]
MASTLPDQNVDNWLIRRARLRIDDLNVDTLPNTFYIEANIALVWPYSSSTQRLSLLLAEHDTLLNKAKGQLKVTFHGACAKEVAKTRVGIGDRVKVGLDQFELAEEHDFLSTPGKKADFDLHIRKSVTLEIVSPTQGIQHVNYVAPETPPFSPRAPQMDGETAITNTPVISESVPALRSSGRLSLNSFPGSLVDPFTEEDGFTEGRGRKRTKFARYSGAWRLADTSDEELDIQPLLSKNEPVAVETSADNSLAVLTIMANPVQSLVPDEVQGKERAPTADAVLNYQSLSDAVALNEESANLGQVNEDDDDDNDASKSSQQLPESVYAGQHAASSPITIEDEDSMPTPRLQAVLSANLPLISPLVARSQHFLQFADHLSELEESAQPDSSILALENLSQDAELDITASDTIDIGDPNIEAGMKQMLFTEEQHHVDLDLLQQQIDMEHMTDLGVEFSGEGLEDEDMYGPHPEQSSHHAEPQPEATDILEMDGNVSNGAVLSVGPGSIEPDLSRRDKSQERLLTPPATQVPVVTEPKTALVQQSTIVAFPPTPTDSQRQQSSQFGFDGIQDVNLGAGLGAPDDVIYPPTLDSTPIHRASERLLGKLPASNGFLSEYFNPQKAGDLLNVAETPQDREQSLVLEFVPESSESVPPVSHNADADVEDYEAQKMGIRGTVTPLSYYTPLASLTDHFGQVVDVMALCTANSTTPERAKTGPKDFYTSFHLADATSSKEGSTTVTAQLFRPSKSALPYAKRGDVVLLRNVKVQTKAHKPLLVSCDESAWAVFDTQSSETSTKIAGPPIEYGASEQDCARSLAEWWSNIGYVKYADFSVKSPRRAQQRPSSPRISKRPVPEGLDLRRSPRRPITVSEVGSPKHGSENIHESFSPSPGFQPQPPLTSPTDIARITPISALPAAYSPPYLSESGDEVGSENSNSKHEILRSGTDVHKTQFSSSHVLTSLLDKNVMAPRSPPARKTSVTFRDAHPAPASDFRSDASMFPSDTTTSNAASFRNGAKSAPSSVLASMSSAAPSFPIPTTPIVDRRQHDMSPDSVDPGSAHADSGSTATSVTTASSRKRYKRRSISLIHELRDGTQYIDVEETELVSVSGSETGSDIVELDENGNLEEDAEASNHGEQHDEDEHIEDDAESETARKTTIPLARSSSPIKKRGRPPKNKDRNMKLASSMSGRRAPRVTRSKAGDGPLVHELRDGTEYVDPTGDENKQQPS